jgi:hypothetical protein
VSSGAQERRRSPYWWTIGGVLGALAVSGAVWAAMGQDGSDGDGDSDGGSTTTEAPEPAAAPADGGEGGEGGGEGRGEPRTDWEHLFDAEYAGPVWITVTAPDDERRTVTITWGPWQRRIVHQDDEPRSYLFSKGAGSTVPLTVEVDPAATVDFGAGTPPVDAEDVNDGWTETGDTTDTADTTDPPPS